MERTRALIVSAVIAGTFVTGAAAYAANSALSGPTGDNVGNLQPAQSTPVALTVDPSTPTGVAPSAAPAATPAPTDQGVATEGEHEHEHEDEHGHEDEHELEQHEVDDDD